MARAIIEIPGPSAYLDQALVIAARADAGEWLPETDYHLGFADAAHLFGELTPARLALVDVLKRLGPVSIGALAKHLERNDSRSTAMSRHCSTCACWRATMLV
jgi:predicted transcriptional regulator